MISVIWLDWLLQDVATDDYYEGMYFYLFYFILFECKDEIQLTNTCDTINDDKITLIGTS